MSDRIRKKIVRRFGLLVLISGSVYAGLGARVSRVQQLGVAQIDVDADPMGAHPSRHISTSEKAETVPHRKNRYAEHTRSRVYRSYTAYGPRDCAQDTALVATDADRVGYYLYPFRQTYYTGGSIGVQGFWIQW